MIENGNNSGWQPTLRLSIRVILIAMIVMTAFIITANSYFSSRRTLISFSHELIDNNADMVGFQVTGYMKPANQAARLTLMLVEDTIVNTNDFKGFARYFFDFLNVHRTVSSLNYGNEKGEFIMVKRRPDGSLSTKIITGEGESRQVMWEHRAPDAGFEDILRTEIDNDDPYDPRVRSWYTGAIKDDSLHWTEVYVFHSDKQPGITASIPHKDSGGKRLGVLSVDIGLFDLSHFLKNEIQVGKSGQAFLIDRNGQLIASRQVDELTIADKEAGAVGQRLRYVGESTRPEIAALKGQPDYERLFSRLYNEPRGKTAQDEAQGSIRYEVDGVIYIATLHAIDISKRRWLVGVLIKEDEYLADAKKANLRNALTAIVLTILAILIGGTVATYISRSLALLEKETINLENLEFSEDEQITSKFVEVDQVLTAFRRMKTGLRAFGKFVPIPLVRTLLQEGIDPELGGENKEVTLFFSDIRGFTGASERMDPADLADKLGLYLFEMTECIKTNKGTVDKFIGDAVMAFWGAPVAVENHAEKACRTALQCLEKITILEEKLNGSISFYTRIGIHTANVIIGNFGAPERLNYTAIGDGVNLASRLEGVNKQFGTQILVSDDTYELVKGVFEFRKIGLVAVKGRDRSCAIYELLGEKGKADGECHANAREYEKALEMYLSRKWGKAITILEAMNAKMSDDVSISYLLDVCRTCQKTEPPEDWDGVFTMDSK